MWTTCQNETQVRLFHMFWLKSSSNVLSTTDGTSKEGEGEVWGKGGMEDMR